MKIAISQRLVENQTYPEIRDALDVQWGRWFAEMGWLPLPLATGFQPVSALLNGLAPDAVLLTGGNDLAQFNQDPLSAHRDAFESDVLNWALTHGVPVVGVCRGAQLLAQRFGAALDRIRGHVAKNHACFVVHDHPLAPCLAEVNEVNSYHQIGIIAADAPLLPLALAGDGSWEAFTHAKEALLGIMWHPEREMPFLAHDKALIQTFLAKSVNPAK